MCTIAPSIVDCNQHWGILAWQASGNMISSVMFDGNNAGAADEGGIFLSDSTSDKTVITGCHFELLTAGTTGIEVRSYHNTITGNYFRSAGVTPTVVTFGTGMNNISGNVNASPYAISVADSGDANHGTLTLLPRSPYVEITCNDAHGGTITMSETNPIEGVPVVITNVSANHVDFADAAGVSELNGALEMDQYETLTLVYIGDRWVELNRSEN